MTRLFALIFILALQYGCSVVSESGADQPWECASIDPLLQELPANPCFRAVLAGANVVTLQWRVVNSRQLVYIYDDFGPVYQDVGLQTADCSSKPQRICSKSIGVETGGFRRWILKVENPSDRQINVAASITVPMPFPPVEVSGGGFVDRLAPTSRTISWAADPRNAPLDESLETAWIELTTPEAPFGVGKRLPRSGPEASFVVPAAALLKPGSAVYSIRDCRLPTGSEIKFCSKSVVVNFYTGADRFLMPNPFYTDIDRDLTITFTNQSGDVRRLRSPTLIPGVGGQPYVETPSQSVTIAADLLTPGSHMIELMSCMSRSGECSPSEHLQILVDSKMDWTLGRDYRDDFLPGVGHEIIGNGEPLDVTYDLIGGIWVINEHSNSIEYVSSSGSVQTFTIPTARQPLLKNLVFEPVLPFAWNPGAKSVSVNFSALGERATRVDSKIWFTQGGGLWGTRSIKNHSRVISVDPSLSDSPETPFDDRLCVYNIPADDTSRLADNQVIGLTGTANRIWIGESRGVFNPEPSAIASFIPDSRNCENLLNFEDPRALANQRFQYCGPGQTPEQDGCMELILLDGEQKGMRVAHLEADPVDGTIWFTDTSGRTLGHLDPEREEAVVAHPIPDPHAALSFFGGFPWSIRVDEDAVYFGEYSTRSILRFDKTTKTFDEIQIPVTTNQVSLHSIDIDVATDRLWFTISNEVRAPLDRTASTIGYIRLSSWREHVAHPKKNTRVSGTIYKGLDSIAGSTANPDKHQSFRGIAVDPSTGKIALASVWRKQVIEITPNAGFWP